MVVSPTTDAEDGTTYTITFPTEAGTVYGGTLDVTTGLLTVTHGKVVLDGSFSPIWVMASGGAAQYRSYNLPDGNLKQIPYPGYKYLLLSDKAYNKDNSRPWFCVLYTEAGSTRLFIGFPSEIANTIAAWNAYLVQNPITIIYPYENPVVYNLTPTEVEMLLGTNNIWADTGDISITYLAKGGNAQESNRSTALNLQKLSAPITKDVDEEDVETEEEAPEENADER